MARAESSSPDAIADNVDRAAKLLDQIIKETVEQIFVEEAVEELGRRLGAILSFLARRWIDGIFAGHSEIRRHREGRNDRAQATSQLFNGLLGGR